MPIDDHTAADILRGNSQCQQSDEDRKFIPNIRVLFDHMQNLNMKQRQAASNMMIGYLSGLISPDQWKEAVKHATASALRAVPDGN